MKPHSTAADPVPVRRPSRLLSPRQIWETYPAFTEGSLRWLLFHRQTNGLSIAIRKIGRRLVLVEDLFLQWVEEHSEKRP